MLKLRQRVNRLLKLIGIPYRFTTHHWRLMIFSLLLLIGIFSYATNPFVRFSIVQDPYQRVELENAEFALDPDNSLILKDDVFFRHLAVVKSWWHLFSGKLAGGKKAEKIQLTK